MFVKSISLENFRNYKSQKLDFCPVINVISGKNGQGKTALLEAVFLCTCARSHRTPRDRELIMHGSHNYSVSIDFVSGSSQKMSEAVTVEYFDEKYDAAKARSERRVFYNGVKLDHISEMMGLFNAVIFAPEDIMIVKGGPGERRCFLDILISQLNRPYFSTLQYYMHVLSQRNALLKKIRDNFKEKGEYGAALLNLLDVFDGQLAEKASEIMLERFNYTDKLRKYSEEYHYSISGGNENLELKYIPDGITGSAQEADAPEPSEIKALYADNLLKQRENDIFRGATGKGPHRDDIEIKLLSESLKSYSSQGQQRTAVLSMKLAELLIIKDEKKESPVLLLDDVLPELDGRRRTSLIKQLNEAQVFISCTDTEVLHESLSMLIGSKSSKMFRIISGKAEMI